MQAAVPRIYRGQAGILAAPLRPQPANLWICGPDRLVPGSARQLSRPACWPAMVVALAASSAAVHGPSQQPTGRPQAEGGWLMDQLGLADLAERPTRQLFGRHGDGCAGAGPWWSRVAEVLVLREPNGLDIQAASSC